MRTSITLSWIVTLPLVASIAPLGATAAAPTSPARASVASTSPEPQRSRGMQSTRSAPRSSGSSGSSFGRSSGSSRPSGFSRPSSQGSSSRTFSAPPSSASGGSRSAPSTPTYVPRSSGGSRSSPSYDPGGRSVSSQGGTQVRYEPRSYVPAGSGAPQGTRYPSAPAGSGSVGEGSAPGVMTRYSSPGLGSSGSPDSFDSARGSLDGWGSEGFPTEGPVVDLTPVQRSGRVRFPAPYRPIGSASDSGSFRGDVPTRWSSPTRFAQPGTSDGSDVGSGSGRAPRLVERYRGEPRTTLTPTDASPRSPRVRVGPSRAYAPRDGRDPSGSGSADRPSTPSSRRPRDGEVGAGAGGLRGELSPVRVPGRSEKPGGSAGRGPGGGLSAGGGSGAPSRGGRGGLTPSYGSDLRGLDELRRKDPDRAGRIVLTGEAVSRSLDVMGAVSAAAVGGVVRPGYGSPRVQPPYGGAVRPGSISSHSHHSGCGCGGFGFGFGFGYGGCGYPWGLGFAWSDCGWSFSSCYGWWWPSAYWWYPYYACSYWRPYYYSYPVYLSSVIYREVEVYDDDADTTVIVYGDSGYDEPVGEAVAPAGPSDAVGPGAVPRLSQRNSLAIATERYLELGDRAFREARFADAVQFYAKAVEYSPEQGDLYLVLADALFAAGDYHYAAYAIRRAFDLDPDLCTVTVDKHAFYADPVEFDRELAVLEQYLVDHAVDQDARLVLATNYLFGGRPAAAVDLLGADTSGRVAADQAAGLVLETARRVQHGQDD